MPLPLIKNFEALLGSVTAERPSDGDAWREFIAIPREIVKDGTNFDELAAVGFWYLPTPELSIDALLLRIAKELEHLGHPAGVDTTAPILALFACIRRSGRLAVEQFNELFANVVDGSLNQYVVFALPSLPDYQFNVGDFTVGSFNSERLAYQCRKAGSDFFERYENKLRAQPLSVERKHFLVKTVHWNRLLSSQLGWQVKKEEYGQLIHRLVAFYYNQLSTIYFEDFFAQLRFAQEIGMALGSGWFDPEALKKIVGIQLVSVYLSIGGDKWGFVSPIAAGPVLIDLGGAHLGLPTAEKLLRDHLAFEGFKSHQIHQATKSFCHFLALAEIHHRDGRHAEGFLHHVIALDLLLGEKGSSTQTVTRRSATLSHEARAKKFADAVADSENIYDARSRYVHEGKEPDDRLWDIARSVCREIAFCLFRLQGEPANQANGFSDRWLRNVDFVAAALSAGRIVPDADLRGIGIGLADDFTVTDFGDFLRAPQTKVER